MSMVRGVMPCERRNEAESVQAGVVSEITRPDDGAVFGGSA